METLAKTHRRARAAAPRKNRTAAGVPGRRGERRPDNGPLKKASSSARSAGLGSRLRFLGAFVREPFTVGSIWPSSVALARSVVDNCDIQPGDTVVELGPGTGAFTELVLRRMKGRGRFIGVEINRSNVAVLRRRFPGCEIINDSAENLPRYLGRGGAHCIISGLAWGNMLPRLQNRILAAILRALAPGGQLVGFGYVHAAWYPTTRRFRRRLRERFARVRTTPVIWKNLPPAFVYQCWRES